jgi:hypothetical protein
VGGWQEGCTAAASGGFACLQRQHRPTSYVDSRGHGAYHMDVYTLVVVIGPQQEGQTRSATTHLWLMM